MDLAGALPQEVFACGFSLRKRRFLRRFLPECDVRFIATPEAAPDGVTVVTWGSRSVSAAEQRGCRTVRIEDGFLRSVGLGADLVAPVSWVVDRSGIHYDSRGPSDLETLLANGDFGPQILLRAADHRRALIESGLTKYNIGGGSWQRPAGRSRVVLVPGQVEQDASIRFGCPAIRDNLSLLKAVRSACPDAYIVFKPHPDVVSGLRAAGGGERFAHEHCDEVIQDVDMGVLLAEVEEVHTLSSLTGFEALLRDKRVITYGQPFYAGWGLTHDVAPISRRARRLSIDQLVAGALLLYPRYLSRATKQLVSAETAVDELREWRAKAGDSARRLRRPLRAPLRRVLRWTESRR